MNIEELRNFCIQKKGVTEEFPFDEVTLVFKVKNKMFALVGLKKWEQGETAINLKCDPDKAIELRGIYESVNPGYHMNKKHWNTVRSEEDVPRALALQLIDHSYERVVAGFAQKRPGRHWPPRRSGQY